MRILKTGGTLLLIDSLPGDEAILKHIKNTIRIEELYLIVEKAIKESYSMDGVRKILNQANLKCYQLDYATLPHEDLMACIDLLYDEQLFAEGMPNNQLNWQLVISKQD
jgi:hypothetical protein